MSQRLTRQHNDVVVEVHAPDGRRYRLIRESHSVRPTVYQLVLEPRDWPARFAMGARCAGIGALVTTLPPAIFVMIASIGERPVHGGDWLSRDLPGILLTCLLSLNVLIGFPIGLFVRKRPHHLSIRFDSTVIVPAATSDLSWASNPTHDAIASSSPHDEGTAPLGFAARKMSSRSRRVFAMRSALT